MDWDHLLNQPRSIVRSLSEGITGYEVKTNNTYGLVTKLSYGSLYIDVDTDSHCVVSLKGEEDTPREYMMSTGMIGSLYESTVWEEITGEESVSTISILAKASEEDIDILLISGANLDTEIEKLNTDEATKQEVVNAVNSGKVVTIPVEDITMGDWHGTGYIVTNPETGAGAYMISGGLNGGSVPVEIDPLTVMAYSCGYTIQTIINCTLLYSTLSSLATLATLPDGAQIIAVELLLLYYSIMDQVYLCTDFCEYLITGEQRFEELVEQGAFMAAIALISMILIGILTKAIIKSVESFGYDDKWIAIDEYRTSTEGLEPLGETIPIKGDHNGTVSFIEVNGTKVFGVNSSLLSEAEKDIGRYYFAEMQKAGYFQNVSSYGKGSSQVFTHAEAYTLMKTMNIYGSKAGKNITIYCDRPTCSICQNYLGFFKEFFKLDSLTVVNKNGNVFKY